jgi:hypothetical protein
MRSRKWSLGRVGSRLQYSQCRRHCAPCAQRAGYFGQLCHPGPGLEVAAQRSEGQVLADQVAEPDSIGDGALAVADPEPLAGLSGHLQLAYPESSDVEEMHPGRRVVDDRSVRTGRHRQMHLSGDLVAQIPIRQCRVQADHPVRRPAADRNEVHVGDASTMASPLGVRTPEAAVRAGESSRATETFRTIDPGG